MVRAGASDVATDFLGSPRLHALYVRVIGATVAEECEDGVPVWIRTEFFVV